MEEVAVLSAATVAAAVEAAVESIETATGEIMSREKQLSRSSSSSSDEMHISEILKFGGKTIAPTQETNIIFIPDMMDKTLILDRNHNDNDNDENNNPTLPPSTVSLVDISRGANAGYEKLSQHDQDLYLETLHKLPDFHKFYCPNCNSCITKVIILRDTSLPGSNGGSTRPVIKEVPETRRPTPRPVIEEVPETRPSIRPHAEDRELPGNLVLSRGDKGGSIRCSNCFSFLAPIGTWISSQLGFGQKNTQSSGATDGVDPSTSRIDTTSRDIFSINEPGIHEDNRSFAISIPPSGNEPSGQGESGGKSIEIIKSIVYGGLTEAITSLGIVTSAASAKTPTENIVALALANLVTGLIVISNNLYGLKSNQLKKESNEAQVDPYEEALGDRDHYFLHYTTAILSFLLFGLLPPLVYGFSFRDTDDGDLKLAAVAVASLLCIALLAIGKAYVSNQRTWKEFAKTLVYYISLGFGASGLSYLAGKEFNVLLEQLGWFKKDPLAPTLLLPNMNFAKPTWGSI